MRWAIVRLIWFRELRDQLRDRRTVLMIVGLPLVLYPLLGIAVIQFALSFSEQPNVVGVVGRDELPPELGPFAITSWIIGVVPAGPAPSLRIDAVASAVALTQANPYALDYPPLVAGGQFARAYFESPGESRMLRVAERASQEWAWALESKQVDLLLKVETGFRRKLEAGQPGSLELVYREGDDRSRLASRRMYGVLNRWKKHLRAVRLLRHGLPTNYDEPLELHDPEREKTSEKLAAEGLVEILVRIFPFILVMWSLAGALYPAIDLCAGEKERGTMETLLISPASREEIVWGKFLTIWVFSAATALLNLVSMALTTWQLSGPLAHGLMPSGAIFWSIFLVLPLSAFFSAICLALGAYARSSKEGQYYLMPLFLLTMPFIFITLAPGVELNQLYSLVPVTGVALLMQELLTVNRDQVRWLYFGPVLASITLYGWLALRWAIEQFKREEVLFREAERLDLGLWLRRLFREKEALPSTGQAVFCFTLILVLRWFSLGIGDQLLAGARTFITSVAFVAVPPVLMVLLLTKHPRHGLALLWPAWWALAAAVVLSLLLYLPQAEFTRVMLDSSPAVREALHQSQLFEELRQLPLGFSFWEFFLVVSLLPHVCEEVAFRGFILTGLRQRYRPWPAILLSSFLFALSSLNVFQFLPAFTLGVVLGMLAVRTGSIIPGMLFHVVHAAFTTGMLLLFHSLQWDWLEPVEKGVPLAPVVRGLLTVGCSLLALLVLAALAYRFPAGKRASGKEIAATAQKSADSTTAIGSHDR